MLPSMLTLEFFLIAALQQSTFQPVGTMSQLMIDIIYPTSNDLFYIERTTPTTDAEWGAIERSALTVAESGNLLMMPGRARDQGASTKHSKMLVDAGTKAFKAANAKDTNPILALNAALLTSYTTCHLQYRQNYGRG